jgi:hypothetical protein
MASNTSARALSEITGPMVVSGASGAAGCSLRTASMNASVKPLSDADHDHALVAVHFWPE